MKLHPVLAGLLNALFPGLGYVLLRKRLILGWGMFLAMVLFTVVTLIDPSPVFDRVLFAESSTGRLLEGLSYALALFAFGYDAYSLAKGSRASRAGGKAGYVVNIEEKARTNQNFRQVLYTGEHLQLVVMSVGEEIGMEVHEDTDQFIRIEEGTGKAIVADQEHALLDGSIVFIPAGSYHNIVNTGTTPLKLYTLYAPPHHKDGTVHATKADADQAEAHH